MGFGLHPLAKWDELPRRQRRHAACLQTNKGIQRGICRYASLTRRHRMSAYDTKRTCRRFVVSEDSLTRHRGAADMARQVIFVAARNPNTPGGGYDTYVRAHARAAVRAGFEPHIFCRGSPPGVQETDFGNRAPSGASVLASVSANPNEAAVLFTNCKHHTLCSQAGHPGTHRRNRELCSWETRTASGPRHGVLGIRRRCPSRTSSAD